jgi:two-component system, cell cycle response regulator
MLRLLIIEDSQPDAELTVRQLKSDGIDCAWECVETEADFRTALKDAPDLIISDCTLPTFSGLTALSIAASEVPETPFIFVSGSLGDARAREALSAGATDYIAKGDRTRLAAAVRSALDKDTTRHRRAKDRGTGGEASTGAAQHLLGRRAVLDQALQVENDTQAAESTQLEPRTPAALIMIQSKPTRERFVKLLERANVEMDQAEGHQIALESLAAHVHAVMFTDSIELVRSARKLSTGAATHIAFVNARGEQGYREAMRAGANDCIPSDARGEQFRSHMATARRITDLAASLQSVLTDNRILSTIDELTHSGSRRFFEHQFPREVERAAQLAKPLALIMCDIDFFKRINDELGHQVGDQVLREFADRISDSLRSGSDWVARFGGEEFAIVLPDTPSFDARAVADRLCERISSRGFLIRPTPITITASFGICALDRIPSDFEDLPNRMVRAADAALYQSKRSGRNCVTPAPSLQDLAVQ